jgi:hypothetical protein
VLFRRAAGGIEIAEDPGSTPIHVPLDIAHVAGLRWCSERSELLASAGASPDDCRFFAYRPRREWRRVGDSFADDPVATADRYLAWHGAGITVFAEDGGVVHEHRRGRAHVGPPSLSVSRDCTYLAWVRWRGDDRKLCVMELGDYRVTEYSHSLYRYAWLDDRRLVFLLGSPPRVLNVATGTTGRFLPDRYHDVAVAGDRVWLTSDLRDSVLRCTLEGSDLEQAWAEERSLGDRLKRERRRVAAVVPREDGSAWLLLEVYRGPYTIVRREERWLGPLERDGAGWAPLLDCHQPELGFVLPLDGR